MRGVEWTPIDRTDKDGTDEDEDDGGGVVADPQPVGTDHAVDSRSGAQSWAGGLGSLGPPFDPNPFGPRSRSRDETQRVPGGTGTRGGPTPGTPRHPLLRVGKSSTHPTRLWFSVPGFLPGSCRSAGRVSTTRPECPVRCPSVVLDPPVSVLAPRRPMCTGYRDIGPKGTLNPPDLPRPTRLTSTSSSRGSGTPVDCGRYDGTRSWCSRHQPHPGCPERVEWTFRETRLPEPRSPCRRRRRSDSLSLSFIRGLTY